MRRWVRIAPLVLLPRWVKISSLTTSRGPVATVDDEEAEEDRLVRQLIQGSDDGNEAVQPSAEFRAGGAYRSASADSEESSTGETSSLSATVGDEESGQSEFAKQRDADHLTLARKFLSVRLAKSNRVEWQCVKCSAYNYLKRKLCGNCGLASTASHRATQPYPARIAALLPPEWYCNVGACRHLNRTKHNAPDVSQRKRYICEACSAPFQGVHDWFCPKCQALNPRGCVQCTECFQSRPVGWTCGACGEERNSVFAAACATCRTLRPTEVTETKRGGVVICSKCRARNHSQWELCSCCVAPLPPLLESLGLPVSELVHDGAASAPPSSGTAVEEQAPRSTHQSNSQEARQIPLPPQKQENNGDAVEERRTTTALSKEPVSRNDCPKDDPLHDDAPSLTQRPTHVWRCTTCKIQHQMAMPYCDTCLQSREAALAVEGPVLFNAAAASIAAQDSASTTGTWCCTACRAKNQPPTARRCQQCNVARTLEPGLWQCAKCSSVNKSSRLLCVGCFDLNPEFDETHLMLGTISDRALYWHCIACGFDKNSDVENLCSKCSAERHGWVCPSCSKRNNLSATRCSVCEGKRELAKQRCVMCKAPTAIGLPTCQKCNADTPKFDHWECKDCQFPRNSYLRSAACQKCGCTRRSARCVSLWVCPTCRAICRAWAEEGGAQNSPADPTEQTQSDVKPKEICYRCAKPRPPDVSLIPSRWICWRCNTSNGISVPQCSNAACRGARHVEWGTTVDCPKCLKSTRAGVDERCSHCQHSLSTLLSNLHSTIVMDEAEVTKWIPGSVTLPEERPQEHTGGGSCGLEDSSESDIVAVGEIDTAPLGDVSAPENTPLLVVPAERQADPKGKLYWMCSLCGARNRIALTECEKCGMPSDL